MKNSVSEGSFDKNRVIFYKLTTPIHIHNIPSGEVGVIINTLKLLLTCVMFICNNYDCDFLWLIWKCIFSNN